MKLLEQNEEEAAAAEHHHHRLVEEIAQRVHERIVAKFAGWLLINAGALCLAMATGIAAYYSIMRDIGVDKDMTANIAASVQMLESYKAVEHTALENKIDRLNMRLDELNNFLRDHGNGIHK